MIADAVDAFLMFIDGETLSVKERLNRLPHCLDQLALVLSDIPSTWDERDYPDPSLGDIGIPRLEVRGQRDFGHLHRF